MTKQIPLTGQDTTIAITIKRFDTSLPLPQYQTTGAAALDLYARVSVTIEPQTVGYVPLNIAIKVPDDYWVQISARSSLHKKGLLLANGIGVGDADFSGDTDEYIAPLYNFSQQPVVVTRGDRIVQMIISHRPRVVLRETDTLAQPSRGRFGTTGHKVI